jgi:hypothetical protein
MINVSLKCISIDIEILPWAFFIASFVANLKSDAEQMKGSQEEKVI